MAVCTNCRTPSLNPVAQYCSACGAAMPAPMPSPLPTPGERAALVVQAPDGERAWPLAAGRVTIGRDPANDIVIGDTAVSRHHAVIEPAADHWVLHDMQSTNGLRIEGQPDKVVAAILRGGERIHIGDGQGRGVVLWFRGPTRSDAVSGPAAPSAGNRFEWGNQKTVTIGRAPDCDIVLADPMMSAHHARIDRLPDGRSVVVDIGARNGIRINGQSLTERSALLAPGDVLGCGGTDITFNDTHIAWVDPWPVRKEVAPTPSPTIRLKPGASGMIIGRDPSADVVLDHPLVSRHHAQLLPLPGGGYEIVDLGSTNHTRVAGEPVMRRPLTVGDIIEIGPYRLRFEGAALTTNLAAGAGGLRIDAQGVCKDVRKDRGWIRILSDVHLTILPNEFVVLVGGSGAGKSTLLKALNGFSPATHGRILVNGVDFYGAFDRFRALVGYVPQADIIHRNLPVDQALRYAARLRLPPDTTAQEREERISKVLGMVSMEACRTKIVDTLSGGQLKRVSTAVELLAEPKLLFLDEPTSGLDPGLDKRMMFTFRQLADGGRTVVVVTHATANIQQCDHVAFMAPGGHLVFFGPPNEALRYFNKTDFADIYTEVEKDPQSWAQRFRHAPEYQQNVVARGAQSPKQGGGSGMPQVWRSGGGLRQLRILTARYFEIIRRDTGNLALLLLQAPIIALLLVVVAGEPGIFNDVAGLSIPASPTTTEAREAATKATQLLTKAQTMLFFLSLVSVWFGVINAVREITKEVPIYLRERMADLRVAPYVGSKLVVMTGLCLVQAAFLLGIVVMRTELPPEGLVFGPVADLFVTLFLTAEAGMAAGLLVSALVSNQDRAMSIVPLVLMPQFLFAGVSFALEGGLKILGQFSLTYWSTDALGSIVNVCGPFIRGGLECDHELLRLNYEATASALKTDWLALLGWTLVYMLLTAWFLKRKDSV